MKIKKLISVLLCVILTCSCLSVLSAGASIENEKTYKPLDLVVVIDSSGSMLDSDPNRSALAAVRMLANMMPANDSRVGLVGFNKTATYLTTDGKGDPTLFQLSDINNVASIKKIVSDVKYNGGTGIGNALFAATDLLSKNDNPERAKAIILFTDGVNDFGNDAIALANCEENEASAIMWAKQNGCPVYCVAYDYELSDGQSSMGDKGVKKLENIANSTNGVWKAIKTVEEIEQLLIEFLADVCDLNYTTVATIPGDGGTHECPINVSPSVVEANIRIAGGDENSIANGKLRLFDPKGNEVELRNSGNVRFDVDATAASIKVTMPSTGEWMLRVEGIKGEDIHVGLLEHFKMNLTSQLSFPAGNPEGIAYNGDEIGIKAWLTYDGVDLDNPALYDAVKSATAVCVPRANPDNKKVINLNRDGMAFTGSFIIPQDCYYDITIRLDWDTVYREDTLEVRSSNKPVYLKGELPDIKVNKNKTVTLDNIYQYVADDENDTVVASISSIGSPDVADVKIDGNNIVATGKKMSSSLVTVQFKDAQGNVIEDTVKVKVNDPVVWIVLVLIILAGVAAAVIIPYVAYLKSLKIKGKLYLTQVELCESNDEFDIPATYDFTGEDGIPGIEAYPEALFINMERFYRKKEKRNVAGLVAETLDLFRGYEAGTPQFDAKAAINSKTAKDLMAGSGKSKIVGTPNGASFNVKIHKKNLNLTANKSGKGAEVASGKKLELVFKVKTDSSSRRNKSYLKLTYYFVSPVRTRKPTKR